LIESCVQQCFYAKTNVQSDNCTDHFDVVKEYYSQRSVNKFTVHSGRSDYIHYHEDHCGWNFIWIHWN